MDQFQDFSQNERITFTGTNVNTGQYEEITGIVTQVDTRDGYAYYTLSFDNKSVNWNTSHVPTTIPISIASSITKTLKGQSNYRVPFVNVLVLSDTHVLFLTKVNDQKLIRKLLGGSKYKSRRSRQNRSRRNRRR
jgi:hypothetical protein